jgi:hypothetical protein
MSPSQDKLHNKYHCINRVGIIRLGTGLDNPECGQSSEAREEQIVLDRFPAISSPPTEVLRV